MGCSSCGQRYRGRQGLYRRATISKRYKMVNGRRVAIETTPPPTPASESPEVTPTVEEEKK